MAKIGISINEVLRDFIGQFAYTYDKYIGPTSVTSKDITSFDLIDHFSFDSVDKLNSFLFLEAPLEIFGHADQLHDGIISHLNEFLSEIDYEGEHEVEIVSREVNKAIPSTMFFLSKTGCRAKNIRFVKQHESEWDGVDVLITANPRALSAKPNDKISVKINTSYNSDSQSDYQLDSIIEFFKDEEFRNKILKPIITTTYEELK
jgi:hypothetical protein